MRVNKDSNKKLIDNLHIQWFSIVNIKIILKLFQRRHLKNKLKL